VSQTRTLVAIALPLAAVVAACHRVPPRPIAAAPIPAGTCVAPRYPPTLQEAGIEGRVVLSFVIDTTGHAERRSIRVVSADHPGFIDPAIQAVLSCTFRPGLVDGQRAPVRIEQPIVFSISR